MGCESQRGESALIEQLIALASQLQARISETCESLGVNAPRFAVLRAIAKESDHGCSQTELASHLGLSESNVCALVERLRSSGMLFRFRSKSDRRRSVLVLTEQGRALAEAVTRAQEAEACAVMSALDVEQQHHLQELVQRLCEHLASSTSVPSEAGRSLQESLEIQSSTRTARRAS